MNGFWVFLIILFCTPFGWVGLFCLSVVIDSIKGQ